MPDPDPVIIHSAFPNLLQRSLIQKICRQRHAHQVCVGPFRRFGYSGASLLLVYFSARQTGLPFLIKISGLTKAEEELSAVRSLRHLVTDCNVEEDRVFEAVSPGRGGRAERWGALLYANKGARSREGAEEPLALREVLYTDDRLSSDELRNAIHEVFRGLDNAHHEARTIQVTLRKHYKKYLRQGHSTPRIKRILGGQVDHARFQFFGTKIYSPLRLLEELPEQVSVRNGRVHGDLHPDNVMIDWNKTPHLIDFAWAKPPRDVLVDYVLLENSVRFMSFPEGSDPHEQLTVDQWLLEEQGWKKVLRKSFRTTQSHTAYTRMAEAVGVIRGRARQCLGDRFSMQRYMLTQFIVLYGLMAYPDYTPYITARALGMIADRLHRTEFDFCDA
jgi:hypothetical protein